MNDAQEIALATHSALRDWGNTILAVGIFIEIGIEGFWPERTEHGRRFPICTLKGFCIFLAGLVLLYGLWRERTEGLEADKTADQIRTNLQERIIGLTPREWLLTPDVEHRIGSALKSYAGQRVAIREYKWQADNDTMEMGFSQLRLATTLDDAGWLNPLGEKIMTSAQSSSGSAKNCNDCLIEDSNIGVTGIVIQVDAGASAKAHAAAHALNKALKSEYFAVGEIPWSADALVSSSQDPNLIVVTIGRKP